MTSSEPDDAEEQHGKIAPKRPFNGSSSTSDPDEELIFDEDGPGPTGLFDDGRAFRSAGDRRLRV